MKPLYVKKNGVVYRVSGTGIPSIYPAANVEYDNTVTSELQATDVQGAIDELSTREAGVQSDWNEDDTTELDYIKNKPQNLVQDASYVHTDNNYDATAKDKVDSLGTASTKDIPTSGDASTTQVVMGSDTRLTDARTPVSHTHTTSDITGLGTAATTNTTNSISQGGTDVPTAGAVWTAIDNLPEPMILKGTLGTGGTITSLPTAAADNEGFTYKVITAGTYASQAAKVGDFFVSCKPVGASAYEWVWFPSGDESFTDTWRNVKVNGTEQLGTGISSGAVDFVNGTNTTVAFDASGNKISVSVPAVSSTSAGVAPKGAAVSSQSQTTKFLREDGTWAAPSYTTNTDTTYTFAGGTNGFTVTPSSGSAQTVTVTPNDSTKLPLAGGTMTGASGIQFPTTSGASLPNNWISAGGGYSTGSGKSGLKIIACEQADCVSGLGQDCGGGPYELSIITGASTSGDTRIRFLSHKVATPTTYTKLAEIQSNGNFVCTSINGFTIDKSVPADAVFTDHTYNFGGTTFYSGNNGNAEHNANNAVKNGNYYYSSNGPATTLGASTADGALYVQSYSDSWVGQIAQDYRNGNIFVRGKNNGTWTSWKKIDAGTINGITLSLVT